MEECVNQMFDQADETLILVRMSEEDDHLPGLDKIEHDEETGMDVTKSERQDDQNPPD